MSISSIYDKCNLTLIVRDKNTKKQAHIRQFDKEVESEILEMVFGENVPFIIGWYPLPNDIVKLLKYKFEFNIGNKDFDYYLEYVKYD